jgi:hypothetical protein
MSVAARPLLVNIVTGLNAKGIEQAQKQLSTLGGRLDKLSTKALKAGAAFAAFQGGRILGDFVGDATVQARDLERNIAALDTVFGSFSQNMRDFSNEAQQFGLSQSEAAKASVFLGSVLKQSGFAMSQVTDLTQDLVRLGADLSITYGYDVQEALLGMTALFRGEYDPIEKFGVAMKQNEINAELAAKSLDHLEGAERRLAEQQIRVQFLFERATDATGAFARMTGTLFAEQQKLEAAINNMLQQAGTPLLKTLADLATAMTPLVEELTPTLVAQFERFIPVGEDMDETAREIAGTLKEVIEAVGLAAEIFVKLTKFMAENIEQIIHITALLIGFKASFKVFTTLSALVVTFSSKMDAAAIKALGLRANLVALAAPFVIDGLIRLRNRISDIDEALKGSPVEEYGLVLKLREFLDSPFLAFIPGAKGAVAAIDGITNSMVNAIPVVQEFVGEMNRFNNIETDLAVARIQRAQKAIDDFAGTTFTGAGGTKEWLDSMFPQDPYVPPEPVKNFVEEFFSKLEEEAEKVAARAKLESLGASPALIDSIVNFGEGWDRVFDNIVKGGRNAVQELQELFDSTAAGIEALQAIQDQFEKDVAEAAQNRFDRLKDEYDNAADFAEKMAEAASDTKDAFSNLFSSFDVLPTIANDLGKFEQQAVSALSSINAELEETLSKYISEDGNLFQQAYENLRKYAADELSELRDIQRQRDQLARKRSLVESITEDVMRSGNLVSLLRGINDELEENESKTAKVVQDTITAGKRLKDFRVTIISNLADPLEAVANKSDMLVQAYTDVVARTRTFVENLKALRQLGLEPQLFNQLVEAGVEAGGETAQALVDGGAKTVDEVNRLTRELNELGAEIGAETADVMYNTGETFINSIIAGIQSEQDRLEQTALDLADKFSKAFKSKLDMAVDMITAEASVQVPEVPQLEQVTKDVSAELNKIESLISGARAFASSTTNAAYQAGALAKLDIYQQLKDDIKDGLAVDLAGVRSGLTTSELEAATGKTSQVNITIAPTVYADTRAGGSQAGEEVVRQISRFVQKNGSLTKVIDDRGRVAL